jgi:hypothetical protein
MCVLNFLSNSEPTDRFESSPNFTFLFPTNNNGSRDSSVGIGTRLCAGRPRSRHSIPGRILGGLRAGPHFTKTQRPDRLWDPPSLLTKGYRGWVKRPDREVKHLPPSSTDIKKSGAIPPRPLRLHGVVVN